jgi:hypothetical protein
VTTTGRRYEGDQDRHEREQALRSRVSNVGAVLLVTAVIACAGNVGVFLVGSAVRRSTPPAPPPAGMTPDERRSWQYGQDAAVFLEFVCLATTSVAVYLPVFLAGLSLPNGRGYSLGITAAVLAMLPCSPGCLMGVPVGIWALLVLTNEDVKRVVFRR